MLPEFLGLGLTLAASAFHGVEPTPAIFAWSARLSSFAAAKTEPPRFRPAEHAVSNWRSEAIWNLALAPLAAVRLAIGKESDALPRCVKLNNYWCIKKAGWNGEIASDAEGHVAFASALEGAAVAALLLRHYYVDLNRHSALAIVSRWAPAQCEANAAAPPAKAGAKVASTAMTIPSLSDLSLHDLAPAGIQNTLRARWLGRHAHTGAPRRVARKGLPLRHSIVRTHMPAMMPAPEIAVGMGERDIKLNPVEYTALGLGKPLSAMPMTSCMADGPRIAAYARHAMEGVALSQTGDLKLFAEDGSPTPNLARVMLNMAAVEIGPLSVQAALIDAGMAAAASRGKPRQDEVSSPQP